MNEDSHGKLLDNSSVGTLGTITGATYTSDGSCQEGNCLSFDGSTDDVKFGDVEAVDTSTNLSICAWVFHDSLTDDDWIMGKSTSSFTDGVFVFRDDSGGGRTDNYKLGLAENATSDSCNNNTATNSSPATTWTHVCFTAEAASATGSNIYVNGVLDANSPVDCSTVATWNAGSNTLRLGESNNGDRNFAGDIDEVLLIERTLTATEVLDIYENGLK